MRANDVRKLDEVLRHGAYVCLRVPPEARTATAAAGVPALAERLKLANEFDAQGAPPPEAIAFLKRVGAEPGNVADDGLLQADAVVHVAGATAAAVAAV